MPRRQTQEVGGLCSEAADFNANDDEPAAPGTLEPAAVLTARPGSVCSPGRASPEPVRRDDGGVDRQLLLTDACHSTLELGHAWPGPRTWHKPSGSPRARRGARQRPARGASCRGRQHSECREAYYWLACDSSNLSDAASGLAEGISSARVASGRSPAWPGADGVPDRDVLTSLLRHLRRRGPTKMDRKTEVAQKLGCCACCGDMTRQGIHNPGRDLWGAPLHGRAGIKPGCPVSRMPRRLSGA